MENFESSAFINWYYEAHRKEEGGALPLGLAVEIVAQRLTNQHNPTPEIRQAVLEAFLESPSPQDLEIEAPKVIAQAIAHGMTVVPWTVGDKGSYYVKERNTTYPAYDFQAIKIEKSKLQESIRDQLIALGFNPDIMEEKFIIDISNSHKEKAFEARIAQGKYKNVLVVDDQPKNIANAKAIAAKYSVKIDDWCINHEDHRGSFDAFAQDFQDNYLKSADAAQTIIFFDFDDTIYRTWAQLDRAAEIAKTKLKKAGYI